MAPTEGIEDRGAGGIATRVLQRVRAVFSRAVALGYREVNPAGEIHNHLKPRKKGQQTALASTILNEAVTEVDDKKHRMWSVDAVERALVHAEQKLTTTGRDGKIRSKNTIPPGNDPNPPRDREH
jgi:endonuclease YncB( thermonuclease family)